MLLIYWWNNQIGLRRKNLPRAAKGLGLVSREAADIGLQVAALAIET
jgi:hypothetical protein